MANTPKNTHQHQILHLAISPFIKLQSVWRTLDFGTKFAQENMNDKIFEKLSIKFEISVILEKFSFWDQVCPKTL